MYCMRVSVAGAETAITVMSVMRYHILYCAVKCQKVGLDIAPEIPRFSKPGLRGSMVR